MAIDKLGGMGLGDATYAKSGPVSDMKAMEQRLDDLERGIARLGSIVGQLYQTTNRICGEHPTESDEKRAAEIAPGGYAGLATRLKERLRAETDTLEALVARLEEF